MGCFQVPRKANPHVGSWKSFSKGKWGGAFQAGEQAVTGLEGSWPDEGLPASAGLQGKAGQSKGRAVRLDWRARTTAGGILHAMLRSLALISQQMGPFKKITLVW